MLFITSHIPYFQCIQFVLLEKRALTSNNSHAIAPFLYSGMLNFSHLSVELFLSSVCTFGLSISTGEMAPLSLELLLKSEVRRVSALQKQVKACFITSDLGTCVGYIQLPVTDSQLTSNKRQLGETVVIKHNKALLSTHFGAFLEHQSTFDPACGRKLQK